MKTRTQTRLTSLLMALILILTLVLTIFATMPAKQVSAEQVILDDNQEIGLNSGTYFLTDQNLYNALVNIYNANFSSPITTLTVGSFKTFTSLDLSNKGITDLSGMQYFNFSNLTHLNLSNNEIAGDIEGFYNITAVTHLNLSNNQLELFDAGFSTILQEVNLKNNKLTTCDISTVAQDAVVDLSFNHLSSFDNLTLPTHNITINLTHNMLTQTPPQTIYNLNLGFQGAVNDNFVTKGSAIKFYGLQNVTQVNIYKKEGETYTLIESLIAGEELLNLQLGNYKVEFIEDVTPKVYQDIIFTARPQKPQIQVWQGDKQLSKVHNVAKPTQLKFIGEGTIKYSLDYGKTVHQSSQFNIDTYGTFIVQVWVEEDGFVSEKVIYTIYSNYVPPTTFVWLILGTLLLIALFYVGYLSKNWVAHTKTSTGKINKGFE